LRYVNVQGAAGLDGRDRFLWSVTPHRCLPAAHFNSTDPSIDKLRVLHVLTGINRGSRRGRSIGFVGTPADAIERKAQG
jgi:hypothetical protein